MTTIPPRQVDETLTRAREAVLDPECSPSDVERLLGEAVDDRGERVDIPPSRGPRAGHVRETPIYFLFSTLNQRRKARSPHK